MTAAAVERPQAPHDEPLPSVFAVRAELEPHADLRHFDREVDAGIAVAAATGSFEQLRTALLTWLGHALQVKDADHHCRLSIEERGENRRRLVAEWLAVHTQAS